MALQKRFNGKVYYFEAQYHNKERALAHARKMRKIRYKARVTKLEPLTWAVWTA